MMFYLDGLRIKTKLMTDWWDAEEIESRLRRHPDIAARYPKLLKLLHTKNE